MYLHSTRRPLACIILAGLLSSASAHGQPESKLTLLEVGGLQQNLSGDYGNWRHAFLRVEYQAGARDRLRAEVVSARQFGESGTLFVLSDIHELGRDDYISLGVSGSSGGNFFPSRRLDISYSRKWLEDRNLVTTLSMTNVNAKDGHRDNALQLQGAYYLSNSIVLQGGLRINRSNPGGVGSNTKFLAISHGRQKERLMSLYHGRGTEAYSYIGANAFLVNFHSTVWTGTWRQWLTNKQGFQLRAERYSSPFYQRRGAEVAMFQEF